jgi:hypothetical protein
MSKHQGLTLAELEAQAFERQPSHAEQAAQHQVDVVKGLIAMRKAGLLKAVHAHESLLAIELPGEYQKRITWATAERLVQEFRECERQPKRQSAASAGAPSAHRRTNPAS